MLSLFQESYDVLLSAAKLKGFKVDHLPSGKMTDSELVTYSIELNKVIQRESRSKKIEGVPPGNWYMVTITSPKGVSEEYMMNLHNTFIKNISDRAFVFLAALECSSIYHVHYLLNWKSGYAKNLKRDISRASGSEIVDVGGKIGKIRNLQQWRGAINYTLKIGYDRSTCIRTLIDHR